MACKFINKVTATDVPLQAGVGLKPCTKHIQYVPYNPESGSHGRIIFVDTPAFPDPEPKRARTQQQEITRIENAIAEWLEKRYTTNPDSFQSNFLDKFVFVVLVANAFG